MNIVVSLVLFQCLVVITQFLVVRCEQDGVVLSRIILKDTYAVLKLLC